MDELTRIEYKVSPEHIDEDNLIIDFKITTNDVDSYKEIVNPSGVDLTRFANNPVVFWMHNMFAPPIARGLVDRVKITDDAVVMPAQFTPESVYAFGHTIYKLYKENFLQSVSIGFIPTKITRFETDEERDANKGARAIIEKWQMLEFSAVTIPANENAVALSGLFKTMQESVNKEQIYSHLHLIDTERDDRTKVKLTELIDSVRLGILKANEDHFAVLLEKLSETSELNSVIANRVKDIEIQFGEVQKLVQSLSIVETCENTKSDEEEFVEMLKGINKKTEGLRNG